MFDIKNVPETPFFCDGNVVYCLKQESWKLGKPVMVNDIYFQVNGTETITIAHGITKMLNEQVVASCVTSIIEFKAMIYKLEFMKGEQRAGQFAYNIMHLLYPKRVVALNGGDFDPFYDDRRIDSFITKCLESE